ncbi:MAG: histidinol-phosphate transaminase [Oscillospiraceae bacterium]|nr:histidinol-phosphate transaminase [Oscillospiraceae bacterium]
MSRFFSPKYANLTPYTPGEQPKDTQYVKLNTNESPFPPSPNALRMAAEAAANLQLYSDPECRDLVKKAAEVFRVAEDEVIFTNGSDEVLNFAFMAFCDESHPAVFPDISYGFYKVFAALNGIPYEEIPLAEDFMIKPEAYCGIHKTVVLANPNAPTGLALSLGEIEEIIKSNPNNVVIIDEAYVDFGAESVIPLVHQYDNLLVTGTFSKSRSLAGGRLGFGIGCKKLICDLNTIKYATNPYNVNRMTMAAGVGTLLDEDYTRENCQKIIEVRQWTMQQLKAAGFVLTDSKANFLFAMHPRADGREIYLRMKKKGVLIRHFDTPALCQYNRITIGSRAQMEIFLEKLKEVLEELI